MGPATPCPSLPPTSSRLSSMFSLTFLATNTRLNVQLQSVRGKMQHGPLSNSPFRVYYRAALPCSLKSTPLQGELQSRLAMFVPIQIKVLCHVASKSNHIPIAIPSCTTAATAANTTAARARANERASPTFIRCRSRACVMPIHLGPDRETARVVQPRIRTAR